MEECKNKRAFLIILKSLTELIFTFGSAILFKAIDHYFPIDDSVLSDDDKQMKIMTTGQKLLAEAEELEKRATKPGISDAECVQLKKDVEKLRAKAYELKAEKFTDFMSCYIKKFKPRLEASAAVRFVLFVHLHTNIFAVFVWFLYWSHIPEVSVKKFPL